MNSIPCTISIALLVEIAAVIFSFCLQSQITSSLCLCMKYAPFETTFRGAVSLIVLCTLIAQRLVYHRSRCIK
ncbi:hypothetical protein FKM82_012138 [Ascaphus truei]